MKVIYKPKFLFQNLRFLENKAVLVENGIIKKIDDFEKVYYENKDAKIIKWDKLTMIPGTVNVHNHSFQSLLRSVATDKPFLVWRDEALYKFSPMLKEEDIYTGALFAFTEMLRYGVTTVSDFFYVHNDGIKSDEAVIRAAKDVGIRLVLARTMYDWDGAPKGYQETIEVASKNIKTLAAKYQGDNMVTISPAPHSLHAASLDMIIKGHNLAKELNTKCHIHVAEEMFEVNDTLKNHGLRPVELLDKIGVLDERTVAVHSVWLNEKELRLMGQRKVNLAYCPSSNMFLADGVTNIPELIKNGVTVGLGTDGACSNNRISVFEEMRMVSLLQKVNNLDCTIINYNEAFAMGTENGGKVLGIQVGKIEEGYMADFVGIDADDLSLQPIYSENQSLIPNIVYSMQPNAISNVVVAGKERVINGNVVSVNEKDVVKKVKDLIGRLN